VLSFWLLAFGFWLLAFGFWLLAFGFWLTADCWLLLSKNQPENFVSGCECVD
jgi:hypothetical protein